MGISLPGSLTAETKADTVPTGGQAAKAKESTEFDLESDDWPCPSLGALPSCYITLYIIVMFRHKDTASEVQCDVVPGAQFPFPSNNTETKVAGLPSTGTKLCNTELPAGVSPATVPV